MTFDQHSYKENIQNKCYSTFVRDVDDFSDSRYFYRVWGYRCEFIGKVLTGISTASVFIASGYPEYKYGGFISGGLGIMAMLFQHLSSFSLNRSRKSTEQLNTTLQTIKIDIKLPDVYEKRDRVMSEEEIIINKMKNEINK
jgi:hypothetical protein